MTYTQKELDRIIESKNTINIRGIKSTNQRKSSRLRKQEKLHFKNFFKEYLMLGGLIIGAIMFFNVVLSTYTANADETIVTSEENREYTYYGVDNYQDYIRKIRLEVCNRVYFANKDFVDETYIHDQDVVVRCSTMMTLIYAYESDFGNSYKCTESNNCFGIKDFYTGGFKVYDSQYEGYVDFAKKYLVGNGNDSFRGHKNRTITEFVYAWSMTDRNTYINFVSSKYFEVYNNLLELK